MKREQSMKNHCIESNKNKKENEKENSLPTN